MNIYNNNAFIDYPFYDGKGPDDTTVLLDFRLQLWNRREAAIPEVKIAKVLKGSHGVSLIILMDDEELEYHSLNNIPLNKEGYALYVIDANNTRLTIVLGRGAYPSGMVIDNDDGYTVRHDCIVDSSSAWVSSIGADDSLTGDIAIRPGRNATVYTAKNTLGIGFSLNAGKYDCLPNDPGMRNCDNFFFSINGAMADAGNNVTIEGGKGVEVRNIDEENAIEITFNPIGECC